MDLLADILETLALNSSLYFRANLSAPFSILVPANPNVIRFHAASEGACWIGLASGESVWLKADDLVLVPHGAAHVVADSPQTDPVPLPTVLESSGQAAAAPLVFGGGGRGAVLVCGHFGFMHEIVHPVIASLPPLIHIDGGGGRRYGWLEQMLAYINEEAKENTFGWREVVQRLAEVLFICVLREYMGRSPHSTGALTALADPRLGKAIRAIHSDPAADWSVNELAERAAMSKTILVERFKQQLGVTPARYVVLWRMHKAKAMLARTSLSAAEIGSRVGYQSEAAFNRVFKNFFGAPPGRFRRDRGDAAEPI